MLLLVFAFKCIDRQRYRLENWRPTFLEHRFAFPLVNSRTKTVISLYIFFSLLIICYCNPFSFSLLNLCCVCFFLFQRKPRLNKLKMYIFPRLKLQLRRQSQFNARKKFQYAILCVRAMVRIKRLRYTVEPLRMEDSLKDPYRVKVLRKVNNWQNMFRNESHLIKFYFAFRIGYRWLCVPSVRSLGEERWGSKSCCPLREYATHRTAFAVFGQSESIEYRNILTTEHLAMYFDFNNHTKLFTLICLCYESIC